MSCVRLLVPAGFWHVSVNLPTAGILDVQRYPLSEAGEQRRGKAEAGSSCDMCLFSEIRLRSSCSLTCCLLLIIILFLYLSLQKHTHTLAPAAWQPLVSFTQLLCCFSHSQHPPPTHTPPLGWMQQPKRASSLSTTPLFTSHPGLLNESLKMWQEYHS